MSTCSILSRVNFLTKLFDTHSVEVAGGLLEETLNFTVNSPPLSLIHVLLSRHQSGQKVRQDLRDGLKDHLRWNTIVVFFKPEKLFGRRIFQYFLPAYIRKAG